MSGQGLRQRLAARRRYRRLSAATAADLTPPDPSAYGAYGANTWVVPPARVTSPERIFLGAGVTILEHAFVSVVAAVPGTVPTLRIGDRTRIGRFAHLACVGEIDIGPDVLMSERVFIGDTYHGYQDPTLPVIAQPMAAPRAVRIGAGAFLGIGATVLAGVSVGEHAYVGAGAVLTEDVPARTLVLGNPARVVRRWDGASGAWVDVGSG